MKTNKDKTELNKLLKILDKNNRRDIEIICKMLGLTNYRINPDLTVDVDSNINLNGLGLTRIPICFGVVRGSFNCSNNKLTSLEGAPRKLLKPNHKYKVASFLCQNNSLTSLDFAPDTPGHFYCYNNQLTSLASNSLRRVKGIFNCSYNPIISLEGGPVLIGTFIYEGKGNNVLSYDTVKQSNIRILNKIVVLKRN